MAIEESKQGLFIYDGSADRFHEWEFRVGIRWQATKAEDKPKTMSMIVESLRGEAAQTAMDIGKTILMNVGQDTNDDGFVKLMADMTKKVFPYARAEAKSLYKAGNKTKGALSRQAGEPMS